MRPSDIAQRFGLRRDGKGWRGDCPACGYAGTFKVDEVDGRVLWWCAACGGGEELTRVIRGGSADRVWPTAARRLAPKAPASDKTALARRLWQRALPMRGTLVERYLASRGLAGMVSDALRFLADHRHTSTGMTYPVLIAAVSDPVSGLIRAVHRTYLRPDGSAKADVTPAKMTLGPVAGGVIRLLPLDPHRPLILAEGIETALSAAKLLGAPAWAAVAAGNLVAVKLPNSVRHVIVAVDNDEVGRREAYRAAQRWAVEGRDVAWVVPDEYGTDMNDVLRRQGEGHD